MHYQICEAEIQTESHGLKARVVAGPHSLGWLEGSVRSLCLFSFGEATATGTLWLWPPPPSSRPAGQVGSLQPIALPHLPPTSSTFKDLVITLAHQDSPG